MKCPRCGQEIRSLDGRCPSCGALSAGPSDDRTIASWDSDQTRLDSRTVPDSPATLASRTTPDPATKLDSRPKPGSHTDDDVTRAPEAAPPSAEGGPLRTGQTFGDRYHIVRLLGLGGMGAVYQAWDHELGVVVALKVIRPDAEGDPEAVLALERRFKQELLLARQVTHKNVVRIHDMGEVEGIKYITMPYIEGEDLASVLKREGRLSVPRTLVIARSMIAGLAAAHEAGVVHRDLKPANIMLDADGDAMIMDFGIARSTGNVSSARPPEAALKSRSSPAGGHTVMGAIVGTVQYMAPEQARAEQVDHRADIYSAGLIIYDMLAGRHRFERAESAIAELTARTLGTPPPLRTIDPAIPPAVERIVNRCVEPALDKRYALTAELVADLDALDDQGKPKPIARRVTKRLAAAVLTGVLAMVGATWWFSRTPAVPVTPEPISVLIADFENRTGDAVFDGALEQALGLAMEGASFVSAYSRPKARQVAEQLKPGAPLDEGMARLIAKRESLNVVLAGSIASSGPRYTVRVRALDLARPEDDQVVATASATAESKAGILPAVERVAGEVRRRLGDTAEGANAAAPSEAFTAASLEAMRAYVRGQDLQVAGKFDEALAAYQEAVTLDKQFGRAYAGMGVIYGNRRQFDEADKSYKEALKHVSRMTEREKFSTMGGYHLLVSRDFAQAIQSYEALVKRYPVDRAGHANLAYAYLNVRRLDEAVTEVRRALALEPGNVLQQMNYSMYSLYAGDFETAVAEAKRIPEASGLRPYAIFTEARAAGASGDLAKARATLTELESEGEIGAAFARIGQADLALMEGRYRAAIKILDPEAAREERAGNSTEAAARFVSLAEAYQGLGERRNAVGAADKAVRLSRQESVLLPAGLVYVAFGERRKAEALAAELDNRLQAQSRSYARLIRGELDRREGRLPAAVDALTDAQKRHDSWFTYLLLGLTYFDANQMPSALAAFDQCIKRRGEVSDVFFADSSTLRYLSPVYYWLARTQESLGTPEALGNYEKYLALRGGTDAPDPLLSDARRRASALRGTP